MAVEFECIYCGKHTGKDIDDGDHRCPTCYGKNRVDRQFIFNIKVNSNNPYELVITTDLFVLLFTFILVLGLVIGHLTN